MFNIPNNMKEQLKSYKLINKKFELNDFNVKSPRQKKTNTKKLMIHSNISEIIKKFLYITIVVIFFS